MSRPAPLLPSVTVLSPEGVIRSTVDRIFCLTRNFKSHIQERGAAIEDPCIFCKPITAFIPLKTQPPGPTLTIPGYGSRLQHELEPVLLCLEDYTWALGVGLDLTLRDIQAQLKKKGLPWTLAKGFDHSSPVSPFIAPLPSSFRIALYINGDLRQEGFPEDMVVPIQQIPSYLAHYFPYKPGDVVFCGTPEGSADLKPGDQLKLVLQRDSQEPLIEAYAVMGSTPP